MNYLKHLLYFIFAFNLVFHSPSLIAQDDETSLAKLSPAEESRYREILAKPIDQSLLIINKIQLYREKNTAAVMLQDFQSREENLKEWAKIDNDGKWNLRGYLSGAGRFEDSVKIGNEIISFTRYPPAAARIRSYVAMDYLSINDFSNAESNN